MEFKVVAASITGAPEHDKFAIEIARKNKSLEQIYTEVDKCIGNIEKNHGYSEVTDMVDELKNVKKELILMSEIMQAKMNNLES